jgi:hypothetical protein
VATSELRAVYDDGKRHSEGRVKGMWSSGIILETDVHPSIGSPVALVVLSGGFDGDRLSAQVAGFEKGNALLLDLPGLDPVRWARLQALVDGKAPTTPLPSSPGKQPPPNALQFIISGGEEEGEPTGVFNVSDDGTVKNTSLPPMPKTNSLPPPVPLDPFEFAPALESSGLQKDNERLRAELTRVSALNGALQDELKDALAKLDAIERSLKR